jgi:hypothetical protein
VINLTGSVSYRKTSKPKYNSYRTLCKRLKKVEIARAYTLAISVDCEFCSWISWPTISPSSYQIDGEFPAKAYRDVKEEDISGDIPINSSK